jgi:hypothetical protein
MLSRHARAPDEQKGYKASRRLILGEVIAMKTNNNITTNSKILEKSLLSCLFIENGAGLNYVDLKISDFYDANYRNIYGAIVNVCIRDGQPFDISLIVAELKKIDENRDWIIDISELLDFTPNTFNPQIYTEKIRELSAERQRLSLIDEFRSKKIGTNEFLQKFTAIENKGDDDELKKELDAKDFDYNVESKQEWVIDYLLPKSEITILAALGASGKTTLALQIALYAMLNINFSDEIVVKNKINNFLVITGEAKFNQINQIIKELLSGMGNPAIQQGQIKIIASDAVLFATTEFGKVVKTPYFQKIKEQVDKINPDLIIIDSLMSTSEVNFNDPTQTMSNYRVVKKLIGERTALILHHFNKSAYNKKNDADEIFGSVNIKNKLRHVLTMKKDKELNKLFINKSNLGTKYKDKEFIINPLLSEDLSFLKGFHISAPEQILAEIIENSKKNTAEIIENEYKQTKKGRPRRINNNNEEDFFDDENED